MEGHVLMPDNLRTEYGQFIRAITHNEYLDNLIMTDNFNGIYHSVIVFVIILVISVYLYDTY